MDQNLLKFLLITSWNHGRKEKIEFVEIFVKNEMVKKIMGKFRNQVKTLKVNGMTRSAGIWTKACPNDAHWNCRISLSFLKSQSVWTRSVDMFCVFLSGTLLLGLAKFLHFFTVWVHQQYLLLEKMGKGLDISYQTAFFLGSTVKVLNCGFRNWLKTHRLQS